MKIYNVEFTITKNRPILFFSQKNKFACIPYNIQGMDLPAFKTFIYENIHANNINFINQI
jgi:hypothetical protein